MLQCEPRVQHTYILPPLEVDDDAIVQCLCRDLIEFVGVLRRLPAHPAPAPDTV
jgi:hypothetical protein